MTINGPIYSRGATSGINTVKSYNSLGSRNSQTISAESMGKLYTQDEGGKQFKSIAVSSGTTTLVSAVTGYSIEVDNYTFVASGAGSVKFLSGSTDLTGSMPIAGSGGISANSDSATFRTASGEALVINTTNSVSGHLSYRLV
jgi:hypothetical protein